MWSLGAITYHLITGVPPFIARDIHEIHKKIEEGCYSLPNKLELSLEVIDFINGLLQFDPQNRFSWMNISSHPFILKKYDNLVKLSIIKLENLKYESVKQLELDIYNDNENMDTTNEIIKLTKLNQK